MTCSAYLSGAGIGCSRDELMPPRGLGTLDANLATRLLATAVILYGWLTKRSPANTRTCGGADCSARRRLGRSSRVEPIGLEVGAAGLTGEHVRLFIAIGPIG